LTYLWQKDGQDITGATGPTYSITPVNFTDQGIYTVIVTDQNGAVTSSSATLSVVGPKLYIERLSDGQIRISWKAPEYYLVWAEGLVPQDGTGWNYVPDDEGNVAPSPVTLPASAGQRFYDLMLMGNE
jgi:hypothetical protein